jgi:hypothetical protein
MRKIKFYKTYRQAFYQALKIGLSEYAIVKDIQGRYCIHIIGNIYYTGIEHKRGIIP